MILARYKKQPSEVKDYDVDYTPWLTPMADTLVDVTATPSCLTSTTCTLEVDSVTHTGTNVVVWVSGGTDGEMYKITLLVTTEGGRVDESELIFRVRDY